MNEVTFHYQRYWTRFLLLTPLLIALIAFHTVFLDKYIESEMMFYLIGFPIILIGIGGALYLFDRYNICVYEGKLRFDNGVYCLNLKRRSKTFRTVEELFGWKAGWYAFSNLLCVQLKTDAGKVKLNSAPLKKGEKYTDSDMVKVIEFIVRNSSELTDKNAEEESIWEYWYAGSGDNT